MNLLQISAAAFVAGLLHFAKHRIAESQEQRPRKQQQRKTNPIFCLEAAIVSKSFALTKYPSCPVQNVWSQPQGQTGFDGCFAEKAAKVF